jgi:hypothetical protein
MKELERSPIGPGYWHVFLSDQKMSEIKFSLLIQNVLRRVWLEIWVRCSIQIDLSLENPKLCWALPRRSVQTFIIYFCCYYLFPRWHSCNNARQKFPANVGHNRGNFFKRFIRRCIQMWRELVALLVAVHPICLSTHNVQFVFTSIICVL